MLTTKKISQILDVSLDDLLAGKDMVKLVERNPVIEKKSANYIMIALYAFIVFSFLITIIDMIIRFPLQSQAVGYSDIQLIVINILGIIIQIVFFTYGLYQAVKGTLSPKRMGVVIVAYFGAMCITGSENIIRYATFLTTAGTLGLTGGITTALGQIPVNLLEAISCGAVFMGANTYIGNAPNFMVKAISDENGVNMPSFFGYILWSLAFLVPVFILDMLVFFL